MKRSSQVYLLLAGALASSLGTTGCSRQPPPPPPPTNQQTLADGDNPTDQPNNSYVSGLGYYHSPFHGWYPYPFNYFNPTYGYYYGGGWHPQMFGGIVPSFSRPYSGTWYHARRLFRPGIFSSGHTFVPAPATPFHPASVIRGGFGSIGSGHFGGS